MQEANAKKPTGYPSKGDLQQDWILLPLVCHFSIRCGREESYSHRDIPSNWLLEAGQSVNRDAELIFYGRPAQSEVVTGHKLLTPCPVFLYHAEIWVAAPSESARPIRLPDFNAASAALQCGHRAPYSSPLGITRGNSAGSTSDVKLDQNIGTPAAGTKNTNFYIHTSH